MLLTFAVLTIATGSHKELQSRNASNDVLIVLPLNIGLGETCLVTNVLIKHRDILTPILMMLHIHLMCSSKIE